MLAASASRALSLAMSSSIFHVLSIRVSPQSAIRRASLCGDLACWQTKYRRPPVAASTSSNRLPSSTRAPKQRKHCVSCSVWMAALGWVHGPDNGRLLPAATCANGKPATSLALRLKSRAATSRYSSSLRLSNWDIRGSKAANRQRAK